MNGDLRGLDNLQLPFDFSPSEFETLNALVRRGELSVVKGGLLDEFEGFASQLFGTAHAVATCNGSSAIYLGLRALGVSHGDEVIMPTYGFHGAAVTTCVLGAKPVFVDIDPQTLALDVEHARHSISERTKAILVLQPWGNVADVDSLVKLREGSGVKLLSDSSHGHDAQWRGKPLGSYFDVVAASFGMGKLVSGGELGVVASADADIHDSALLFSHTNRVTTGLVNPPPSGVANAVGLKLRPHGLALQIGLWNAQRLGSYGPEMQRNGHRLNQALRTVRGVEPVAVEPWARRSYWKPSFLVNESLAGISSGRLVEQLTRLGIRAERNNYQTLLHENPIFTHYYGLGETALRFPNALAVRNSIIQISEHHLLEPNGWRHVAEALQRMVGRTSE